MFLLLCVKKILKTDRDLENTVYVKVSATKDHYLRFFLTRLYCRLGYFTQNTLYFDSHDLMMSICEIIVSLCVDNDLNKIRFGELGICESK